ncbi:MAG: hypothetical protein ACRD26_12435 [Vicinamibacterales bacterium]
MQRVWILVPVFLGASALAGCGGGGDAGEAAVAAPASRGTLLLMDPGTRATAPAAVMGFVHGLNAIVVDGDRVYAGMTALQATRGQDGARTLTFADGVSAQMVPAEKGFELRFSSGETIPLCEEEAR